MMLGEPIDAEEAYRIGLVNRLAPPGGALALALDLAATLATRPAVALRMINTLVDDTLGYQAIMEAALPRVAAHVEEVFQTADVQEGAAAFLEKRQPTFVHR